VASVRTVTHRETRVRQSAARQWMLQPSRCMKFTRMRIWRQYSVGEPIHRASPVDKKL
jgi:hypothetical protein